MKSTDIKSDSFAESNEKDLKFKVGDLSEFESTKIFLLKDMLLTGVKKFFCEKNKEYSTLNLCN